MKSLKFIALLALLGAACTPRQPEGATLRIEVTNPTLSNVGLLVDRTTGYTVELDRHGRATFTLPGVEYLYGQLVYGGQTAPVFLQRGDGATARFDGLHFAESLEIDGANRAANDYLRTTVLPEGPSYELAWEEFAQGLREKADGIVRLLEARGLDTLCPDFARIERLRLRYAYAQPMLVYEMGHRMMTGDTTFRAGQALTNSVRGLIEAHDELACAAEYRDFLRFGIPLLLQDEGATFGNSYERTVATMRYLGEQFPEGLIRQTMLRSLALEYLQTSGVRGTEELQNLANTYLTYPQMLADYRAEIARHDLTAAGRPSPDFTASDREGRSYTLADLRGKYLYIDLWASWCGPCRREAPHLKRLAERFAGRDILFVGVSVDTDRAAWEKALDEEQLPGLQLWLDPSSSFAEDYGVESIPRFILLDKEGHIVQADMLRPSSEGVGTYLEKLKNL